MQTVFIKIKRDSQIIISFFSLIYDLLAIVSISNWIYFFYEKCKEKRIPMFFVDAWILLILFIELYCVFWFHRHWLFLFIGIYGINDVLVATLRDIILSTQLKRNNPDDDGKIVIRNSIRWFLLSLISIFQIVSSFAILLLYFGSEFKPKIVDPITSLYFSIQTFTTLGYGDYQPISIYSKNIIIFELIFFLIIISAKFPIALSLFKTKQESQ